VAARLAKGGRAGWPGAMRPITEHPPMDRERFEREIAGRGEPAVIRGLVADWPIVEAAKSGEDALAGALRATAADEPFEAWFGEPGIAGRFGYTDDYSGFNHERRLATVDQLLDLRSEEHTSELQS